MSGIILDQLNGIYQLYTDGVISKSDAENGMIKTVIYYGGTVENYQDYINDFFNERR